MSKRNSWLNRCLTPKTSLPIPVIWSASSLAWVLLIGLWAFLSYGGVVPAMFLPTPGAVFDAAVRLSRDGTLGPHIWASVEVVMVGFLISSVVAVPIGLMMGSFRVVQAFLEPLVNFIRYLPVTSFVPLFILWIGIGLEQRVSIIIFGVFFQQLVMIADVSKGISKDLINASYTLGSSRADAVLHVIAPASVPGILDTLRVTMGWAWTYLVVAELVAASSGLGYLSLKAMRGFQVDVIFLAIAVIGLLGLITDQLFRFLRLKVAAWAQ